MGVLLLYMMYHMTFHTGVLQQSDDRRAHIDHFLVGVGDLFFHDAPLHALLCRCIEEAQQQVGRFVIGEDFQFVGILDVHDFIADVVGCFHQIDQWMTGVAASLGGAFQLPDAQVVGYLAVNALLRTEEAKLPLAARERRGMGVFHDGGQRGIGQYETAFAPTLETMGEQSEGVGVALEMRDVAPKRGTQPLTQLKPRAFGEKGLDGPLAGMSERWVAHVVGETGCGDNGANLLKQRPLQLRMAGGEQSGDVVA